MKNLLYDIFTVNDIAPVTVIGSRKVTMATNAITKGGVWCIRELHGGNNRWNHGRIYKQGKLRRVSNKEAYAEMLNNNDDGLVAILDGVETVVYGDTPVHTDSFSDNSFVIA